MIVLLAGVTFGIIEGPGHGWGSPLIVGSFAAAAAALVALLVVESRRAEPLLDPRFFASVPFSAATLIAVAAFAALAGFLFLNALYLQDVRGLLAAARRVADPAHGGDDGRPAADLRADRGHARRPGSRSWSAGPGIAAGGALLLGPGRRHPAAPDRRRVRGLRRSASAWSTRRSRTRRSPGCRWPRPAWPRGSRRPAGRSAPRSAWRCWARWSPRSWAPRPTAGFAAAARPAWIVVIGCGLAVLVLGLVSTTPWARETARRTAERFAVAVPRTGRGAGG